MNDIGIMVGIIMLFQGGLVCLESFGYPLFMSLWGLEAFIGIIILMFSVRESPKKEADHG